jgi:cellulose 1,4-beta-cellobiosidase
MYGTCCSELDIWEANKISNAYTPHPCSVTGQTRCSGVTCGDTSAGQRYQGVCDKDGCDFNPYRMGNTSMYGPGLIVDTTKPITVVTQFITADGTTSGTLSAIKRFYVQNGKVIPNSASNIAGVPAQNYITDSWCNAQKTTFGDTNSFSAKGGLAAMGASMDRGQVLVMSIWDDHDVNMLWLDSTYPTTSTKPGAARGTCPTTSGKPTDVESNSPTPQSHTRTLRSVPLAPHSALAQEPVLVVAAAEALLLRPGARLAALRAVVVAPDLRSIGGNAVVLVGRVLPSASAHILARSATHTTLNACK